MFSFRRSASVFQWDVRGLHVIPRSCVPRHMTTGLPCSGLRRDSHVLRLRPHRFSTDFHIHVGCLTVLEGSIPLLPFPGRAVFRAVFPPYRYSGLFLTGNQEIWHNISRYTGIPVYRYKRFTAGNPTYTIPRTVHTANKSFLLKLTV